MEGDLLCQWGMVMYRFEIYDEESPDSGIRYCWKLVSGRDDVVAGSRGFGSRAEAESEVRAFRRGVSRARLEGEPPVRSPFPEPPEGIFRPVPDVTSLRVTEPAWDRRRYPEFGPGPHHPEPGRRGPAVPPAPLQPPGGRTEEVQPPEPPASEVQPPQAPAREAQPPEAPAGEELSAVATATQTRKPVRPRAPRGGRTKTAEPT